MIYVTVRLLPFSVSIVPFDGSVCADILWVRVCVCASHQKLGDTSFNLSLKESILYTDHIDLLQNA